MTIIYIYITLLFIMFTGGVHDRRRNARRAPGTAERPVLGRGGAQRPTVHSGFGTLQTR